MDPQQPDPRLAPDPASTLDAAEEQRRRRVEALRQLAANAPGHAPGLPPSFSAPAASPISHASRHRPRWLIPLVVLLILAMLAGVGYVTLPFFHPGTASEPPIPTSLLIDMDATLHFDCPSSVLWAPDGRRVAVLGSQCAGSSQNALPLPYLAVFDARTGKTVKTFDLSALLPAYGMVSFVPDVAWSPDSSFLVVDGGLASPPASSGLPAILVLPLDGSHPRVFSSSVPANSTQIIWNVHTGQMASFMTQPLPAALSYRWSSDGHIIPDAAFPAISPANSYTGRVASSSGFSFWQSGQIQMINGPIGQPPSLELFTSSQAEWSPDGQFVALNLFWRGVVAKYGRVDQSLCADANLPPHCSLAPLPLPDAALATALHAVQQAAFPTNPDTVNPNADTSVTWSPDGQALATVLPVDQFGLINTRGKATFITLLSVATGQPVKQFRYTCPPFVSYSGFRDCSGNIPVWSPTGQQIAFLDPGAVQLTLWKV